MKDIISEIKSRLGNKFTDWFDKTDNRIYVKLNPEDIVETTKVLHKDLGARFITASGMDAPDGFEIHYHFAFDRYNKVITVKVKIKSKDNPEIESITPLMRGAEWIEREIHELLGIKFKNHPNLKKLLLSDDWPEGEYPLRKDYKLGRDYKREEKLEP